MLVNDWSKFDGVESWRLKRAVSERKRENKFRKITEISVLGCQTFDTT